MTHLIWITNIPTPYRNHRYETMREVFPDLGLTFEVWYMAPTEPGRHWTFEPSDFRYPLRIFRGLHGSFAGLFLHFNPGLLLRLRRSPADIVVVGGFSAPTLMLAPFFAPRRALRLLASESHLKSVSRTGRTARYLKRLLTCRYNGAIVPGRLAENYVRRIREGQPEFPILRLPNIIDKFCFSGTEEQRVAARGLVRSRLKVPEQDQLWVCVARLETFKGLDAFLPLLEGLEGVTLAIAGDGSQRQTLEQLVSKYSLPVRFLGQLTGASMGELFRAADVFVLPSRRDPNPLSAIEAAASGLPLLLSKAAGNAEDLVVEGQNGWIYNPEEPNLFRSELEHILTLSPTRLAEMGARSRSIYAEFFDSNRSVRLLGSELVRLAQRGGSN